jgi:hypothetical protein
MFGNQIQDDATLSHSDDGQIEQCKIDAPKNLLGPFQGGWSFSENAQRGIAPVAAKL